MNDVESILPFLSIWGAVLSTVLALIKIREVYSNRFRIITYRRFTSLASEGNQIFLHNPSNVPITINYFDILLYKKKGFLYQEVKEDNILDGDDYCKITIPAYSTYDLDFSDEYHFDWGSDWKVYIKLHVVGRNKPLKIKVYP